MTSSPTRTGPRMRPPQVTFTLSPNCGEPRRSHPAIGRNEGVVTQVAVRPDDAVAPDEDAPEMGDVEARTNVGGRGDRDARQNLDRPFGQLAEEPIPPSLQSPLLVRPMPESVQEGGKDSRLRHQHDRQRAPAVAAFGVVEVPVEVGKKQVAHALGTRRAARQNLLQCPDLRSRGPRRRSATSGSSLVATLVTVGSSCSSSPIDIARSGASASNLLYS